MSRTPARITTNHFRVARLPSNDFYQYDGTFMTLISKVVNIADLADAERIGTQFVRILPFLANGACTDCSLLGLKGIDPDAWKDRSREVVTKLQTDHPEHFTPRIIYDGGKIAFSVKLDIPTHAV